MGGGEVQLLRLPRAGAVAHAVVRGAEPGAALDDMRIGAAFPGVVGPFPEIADHIVETECVGFEAADRRDTDEAVLGRVDDREESLPGVGFRRALMCGRRIGIGGAGGPFPFGFAGQAVALPACIGTRILECDGGDREIVAVLDRSAGAAGMAPVGARHVLPPLRNVAHAVDIVGHDEDDRAGLAHVGRQMRMEGGIDRAFGHRHMAGGGDKGRKIAIGDFGAVHPEAVDRHVAEGPLLGIDRITHCEAPGRHPDHAAGTGIGAGREAAQRFGGGHARRVGSAHQPDGKRGSAQKHRRRGREKKPASSPSRHIRRPARAARHPAGGRSSPALRARPARSARIVRRRSRSALRSFRRV